jgi:hypothetical protein
MTTPSNLQDVAVCFALTIGKFSITRKVRSDKVIVDADQDSYAVNKKIINSDGYKKIQSLDGEIRNYLKTRALPSLLKRGVYLVPFKIVEDLEADLARMMSDRNDLVDEFIKEYDEEKYKAKTKLRSLYNEADYPSSESIRNSFYINYRIFSAEIPESLADLSGLMYEREKQRAKKFWEDSKLLIEDTLRSEFSKLVDHFVERLQVEPGQKEKVFHKSLISNFDNWVDLFESRNITQDKELKKEVDKA